VCAVSPETATKTGGFDDIHTHHLQPLAAGVVGGSAKHASVFMVVVVMKQKCSRVWYEMLGK
jgi:hypothetical protein